MKKMMLIAVVALMAVSCNSNSDSKKADSTAKSTMETMTTDTSGTGKDLKIVKPATQQLDAAVSSSIDRIVSDYLKIKDALVADNASGASAAASQMSDDLKNIDKSKFTADQKTTYEKVEDDLKENVEHIHAKKDIDHQREHFGMLSDDMTDLVKFFGSTSPLYNDHCPMANENKGSNWLSETSEIKNPYMGKADASCGSAVELIKK